MQSLGERIYDLRKKNGLSQEELANEIGVSRQTVSKWETNTMQPNLESIKSLSSIFKVPLDVLIKEELNSVVAADCIETKSECNVDEIDSKNYIKINKIISIIFAICLTICSFVLLIFSIIIGQTALSTNIGNDTISNFKFDNWMFYLCLVVTLIFLIFAVILWVRVIRLKKNKL